MYVLLLLRFAKPESTFCNHSRIFKYYAVHNNELEGLKFAIAKGVNINTQAGMILNESIVTAINTKSTDILKWVLENGADTKFLTQNSREMIDKYGMEELKSLLFQ